MLCSGISIHYLRAFPLNCKTSVVQTYLEHEISSPIHAVLSLLYLPFVLGGTVVWTASFLVILAIRNFLLKLVQVIFFFVV